MPGLTGAQLRLQSDSGGSVYPGRPARSAPGGSTTGGLICFSITFQLAQPASNELMITDVQMVYRIRDADLPVQVI